MRTSAWTTGSAAAVARPPRAHGRPLPGLPHRAHVVPAVVHFHHARTAFHGTHGGFAIALGGHVMLAMIHARHVGLAAVHARHVVLTVIHAYHIGLALTHPRHVVHAVVHRHPHVAMGQDWRRVQLWHLCKQRGIRGQGAAGIAGAIDGLGKDAIGTVIAAARRERRRSRPRRCGTRPRVTGSTYWPSAATTVIFRPGMRTSKKVMAAALMKRSRTRSPRLNSPSQPSAGVTPFIRKV